MQPSPIILPQNHVGHDGAETRTAVQLLLGFFWPIWDQKKQTFADKIIGSVVIKV